MVPGFTRIYFSTFQRHGLYILTIIPRSSSRTGAPLPFENGVTSLFLYVFLTLSTVANIGMKCNNLVDVAG